MGLKKNFLYSSILTVSNYIFPLITFPYVSRVLGVDNIGICNFVDSVINYIILFSMMGITTIGIREIANDKNDSQKLSQTYSNLFLLNVISTFLILFILIICIYAVPEFYRHKELMYIGAAKILFNLFLVEWFYKGVENFKYITVRSLIIKVIYVISVFIFVRQESDYTIYYFLTVGITIVNAVINWTYSRKHVRFSFKQIQIKKYVKPFLLTGSYIILTSMYISFNVIYLGFVSNDTQVGYYTTATKIYSIVLALITAFTSVMVPRISSLLQEGNTTQVKNLIANSFELVFTLCFPIVILFTMLAPEVINVIAGKGYEGAIIPMQIIMPLIFIVGLSQIFVYQILIPLRKDKVILINSVIGAIVGIVMNFLIVGRMQSIGSAIVLVTAELLVFTFIFFYVQKRMNMYFPYQKLFRYLLISLPYLVIAIFSHSITENPFIVCLIAFSLSGCYFLFSQFMFFKNGLVINILRERLRKK